MSRKRTYLLAMALVAGALVPAAAGAGPVTLGPGQAVLIRGTDIACVFGGTANQIGMACLHRGAKVGATYSFRIDENRLRVFRRLSGKASEAGRWLEPHTIDQPKSPAVSDFKTVAKLSVGGQFKPAAMDIGCIVYVFKGRTAVGCFKLDSGGRTLPRSYGVGLSMVGVEVTRVGASHEGTTVFTAREGK